MVAKGIRKDEKKIHKAAIVAALAGLTAFCAPAADAMVVPNPTDKDFTKDVFKLDNQSYIKPASGSYLTLYEIDNAANPWTVTPVYYDFELTNDYTSFIRGDGPYTDLSKSVSILGGTQNITVKYTTSQNHIRIPSLSENISNKVFAQRSYSSNGGAINNSSSPSSPYNITDSAFFSNSISSGHGGAVYNSGTMGNITGSVFINNSVKGGSSCAGGIANAANATMGAIRGNIFINNITSGDSGGAIIDLGNATIGDIENNVFISNDGGWSGGALFVSAGAKVNSIKSSIFISNIASTGGVFGIKGNITNGISDSVFIANRTKDRADYGGGVLYLYNNSILGDITNCTFISNSTVGFGGVILARNDQGNPKMSLIKDSLFLNNSASRDGGVLYNGVTITNGIKNSTFLNNNATGGSGGAIYITTALAISADNGKTTSFIGNTASSQGGAIWSSADLAFNANNGTIIFQNNTANSVSNAIYFNGSGKTANFNISNGGSVQMYDKMAGSTNYNVNITGLNKATDIFYMYNDIQNAGNIATINVKLSSINNDIYQNKVTKLTTGSTTNYGLDIDITGNVSDSIKTSIASSGTLFINDVKDANIYGITDANIGHSYTYRLLETQNDSLHLGLDDTLTDEHVLQKTVVPYTKQVIDTVAWNDEFGGYEEITSYMGYLNLATTGTTNDSLTVNITDKDVSDVLVDKFDTLQVWAEKESGNTKNFNFAQEYVDPAEKIYTLTKDIATVNGDKLNINGEKDTSGNILSVIDANNHKLFTIGEDTTLNLTNVEIQNAVSPTYGGAVNNSNVTNLSNVTFSNNTANGISNDIHNTGILRIKEGTTTINGGVTGSGMTQINGGDLVISDTSNGLNQSNLTINSGSLTANASKISTSSSITNSGTIDFTGGINTNDITGTGTTKISGAVTNAASLTQNDLTITDTGELNTALSNLEISSNTIRNDGILTLTNEDEIALDITKDTVGDGKIAINTTTTKISGTITDNTIELNHGILTFANPETNIAGANLTNNGCAVDMINNNAAENLVLGTLTLNNNLDFYADVDLEGEKMDRLTANSVTGTGNLNVVGMNLTSDATKDSTTIPFADENLKDRVVNQVTELGNGVSNPYQTMAFSPIYKYDVSYNPEDGNFTFAGGPSGGDFNPAVLAEPVAAQANILQVNNIVTNYAFHHVDTCMAHNHGKTALNNKYALVDAIKDDLNTNNPLFEKPDHEAVWVKPFVTFENVPLKNGPKVSSINYGTMIGYDSNPHYLKHGFEGVWTGYVGYTGGSSHYSGVDITSNGGLLGATYSLFKGYFFNATTVTAGAMHDQANTMYGKDNITALYAGIANKTGYNFDFKNELFVIQPSLMLGYTFANTFDYTNSAGLRIDSDPLHIIQISPGIKFYMNTKSGWQPYVGVNMMWNLMDKTSVKADGVKLPEMSIKPYVQYGIGIQKTTKEHFTAYGQAMMQNGGRNGISLTAGFRWAIGRNHKHEKVQNTDTKPTKTVLKQ